MTFPKALNDKLIFEAYLMPSSLIFVLFCLSEPAKSTILSFPTLNFTFPSSSVVYSYTFMVNMQWDLDDSLFILVCLTERFLYPILKNLYNSYTDFTRKVLSP